MLGDAMRKLQLLVPLSREHGQDLGRQWGPVKVRFRHVVL